ncbi:MAG TPA: hypothetical protein VGZ22_05195, partial [Isosphaeraceae bacterium]|nr:hypothetical protein [Isosphaeraceae bacterium]
MREAGTRRFGIQDVMILVAAVAVGLSLDREHFTRFGSYVTHQASDARVVLSERVWLATRLGVSAVAPFVLTLSLAVLALRLRRPRPGPMQLVEQPGFLASALVATVLAAGLS